MVPILCFAVPNEAPTQTLKRVPMKLTWKDHEEIAWALMDKFPDQDPLKLSFPKLHALVCGLEEFGDNPQSSNEKVLENIQMSWYEERQ